MSEKNPNTIGIIGGIGPFAGVELCREIFKNTIADKDQDHIPLILLSDPTIPDRTKFLNGESTQNPAPMIADQAKKLAKLGATVIGIACNTAHKESLFLEIKERANITVPIINMIEEVVNFLKSDQSPGYHKIGVLCTAGSYKHGVYQEQLKAAGFDEQLPGLSFMDEYVHKAIYDKHFGIKSEYGEIRSQSRCLLNHALDWFRNEGSEAIILGCTELPLVKNHLDFTGLDPIDANWVFARALIRESYPEKLKDITPPPSESA